MYQYWVICCNKRTKQLKRKQRDQMESLVVSLMPANQDLTPTLNAATTSPRNVVLASQSGTLVRTNAVICHMCPSIPHREEAPKPEVYSSSPSAYKRLPFCTAYQSSFLLARGVAARFMNRSVKSIRSLNFTQLNFCYLTKLM